MQFVVFVVGNFREEKLSVVVTEPSVLLVYAILIGILAVWFYNTVNTSKFTLASLTGVSWRVLACPRTNFVVWIPFLL